MARRSTHSGSPRRGQPPNSSLALGRALWAAGRRDEAVKKLKQAVREAPHDLEAILVASRALAARFDADACGGLLERALRLGGRRSDIQHEVGQTYRQLGRWDDAEACFRRACRLAQSPASQYELAALCERTHRLPEAYDLVQSALKGTPGLPLAQLLWARLERRLGNSERCETILRSASADARWDPQYRAEAQGDLAEFLDGQGDYDGAWQSALACKQLLHSYEQPAWEASQFVLDRCRRMMAELTPAHWSAWQAEPDEPSEQATALLTGFPRSGTTLVQQLLSAHPGVVVSDERELFSAEVLPRLGAGKPADAPLVPLLGELTAAQRRGARRFYFDAMQGLLGSPFAGKLHVDKNPAMNLMIPPMRRVFPDLKLIVVLRDPRDVIVSCFLRYLPINPVSVCFLTLERAVERYVLDISAWLQFRDFQSSWIEVRYEDAVADVRQFAQRLVSALELPWHEGVLDYRQRRASQPILSPTYADVAEPIYGRSVGRWRNYEHHLAAVSESLAPTLKALNYAL